MNKIKILIVENEAIIAMDIDLGHHTNGIEIIKNIYKTNYIPVGKSDQI